MSSSYLESEIGDEADYVTVLFFSELNSAGCALAILIVLVVNNYIKTRKQKNKKQVTKGLSLDEQLAEIKWQRYILKIILDITIQYVTVSKVF